jgi:acetoin utilization deacetylase AcuC-like enzyme
MDLLTDLGMNTEGFFHLGNWVREISNVCQGKEIDFLASGYNLKILPYCWTNLIFGLLRFPVLKIRIKEKKMPEPLLETEKIIEKIKKVISPYWKCFKKC